MGIGLVYGIAILAIGGISGACVNPFRYLGPGLLVLSLSEVHVFVLAPIVGGILAALIYDGVF